MQGREALLDVGDSYLGLFEGGSVQDQFVLIESRRGTGKTRAILTLFMTRAIKHPGSRWLIVRSTRTRLTDSAVATFIEQVLPLFGMAAPKCQREQISNYRLPNGSEFIFQGLDDPNRQQSVECAGVYVVEGVEIPQLETITALAASMRQVCDPPIESYQCIVDCNPGAPGHPLNRVAERFDDSQRMIETREQYERLVQHNQSPSADPNRWKRIVTQHYDNPGYFDVVTWTWTKIGAAYLKTLSWLTGFLRKRWLYGLWHAAEGSVFGAAFEARRNVCKAFNIPASWPVFFYLDPGYDHPTGIFWLAVGPTGKRYVVDELYDRQTPIADDPAIDKVGWASLIKARESERGYKPMRRFMDPRYGFSKTAYSNGTTIDEQYRLHDLHFEPWARLEMESKDGAVNQVRTSLIKGELVVFDRCVNTQMELQSWSYKRNARGEQLVGDDQYEDRLNHIIDGLLGAEVAGHRFEDAAPREPEPLGWQPQDEVGEDEVLSDEYGR